jgi:hypothetical protein
MASRLWHMNADFEIELSSAGAYRRLPAQEALNHRLAPHLLRLAHEGDALLLREPWTEQLKTEAQRRGIELVSAEHPAQMSSHIFTPWGWTESAAAAGRLAGAITRPLPFDVVARVNSKLWSHALEVELGWALPGAATASTFEELEDRVSRACPGAEDKWVIKSLFGFAARDRVLGRGPKMEAPQAKWAARRLAAGERLLFQPWLEVKREYGIVMEISPGGAYDIHGISDLQTNGAGTGHGYILGRRPRKEREAELENIACVVAKRLYEEGYFGPVGIDALEHARGLHRLLEINARYTMGFIAVAVEKSLKPKEPTFWSLK